MNTIFPENPGDIIIDLEINLQEFGGMHRFKTLQELDKWVEDEFVFWKWLEDEPARSILIKNYGEFHSNFFRSIHRHREEYQQIRNKHKDTQYKLENLPQNSRNASEEMISEGRNRMIYAFNNEVKSHVISIYNNIISDWGKDGCHLFRGLPESTFILEYVKSEPKIAPFILHQLIFDNSRNFDFRANEVKGRLLALQFVEGWINQKPKNKRPFAHFYQSWDNEIAHYKSEYENLKSSYNSIESDITQEKNNWINATVSMRGVFEKLIEEASKELNNTKETYTSFMQLYGPMEYWRSKKIEHDEAIKVWKKWCVISACFGLIILGLGCNLFLPESTASGLIPWKNIAALILLSTIVIWLMRFPFKMILSHIHLKNDAREREVMISTYMALLMGKNGQQGAKLEDIQLVLTSIFRPATSGIIKDDGGPVSFIDMISRIGKN